MSMESVMDAITELTKPGIDQFDNWRRRIKGDAVPTHPDHPDAGFYRNRNIPVAYWYAADKLHCHIGGKSCFDLDRANTAWPFASKEPVTKTAYDEFLKTGTWPDQHSAVTETLSNNAPRDDDSIEGLEAQIDMLANEADMLIQKGAAKTQKDADLAADVATRLGELWTKADNLRKVEKEPHFTAARGVDDKWRSLLDTASIYSRIKAAIITPFINAENARRRRKHEEAEQKAREAAAAAAEAHRKAVADAAAQNAPPPEPPAPIEQAPAFEAASAGTRGRKVSARTLKIAIIEDYAKALASFAQHEAVKAVVQDLANKQARIGMATPGCKIVEEGEAV